jgi:hypothetical protein
MSDVRGFTRKVKGRVRWRQVFATVVNQTNQDIVAAEGSAIVAESILQVDHVPFKTREMESCVRLD